MHYATILPAATWPSVVKRFAKIQTHPLNLTIPTRNYTHPKTSQIIPSWKQSWSSLCEIHPWLHRMKKRKLRPMLMPVTIEAKMKKLRHLVAKSLISGSTSVVLAQSLSLAMKQWSPSLPTAKLIRKYKAINRTTASTMKLMLVPTSTLSQQRFLEFYISCSSAYSRGIVKIWIY